MSTITPIPSLSASGWVTSPAEKADRLFSHFYLSDKFQTYLYGDKVTSLPWLIQEYGHDLNQIVSQMKVSLETYLNRYYAVSSVNITTNDDATLSAAGKIELKLYASMTEADGQQYSLGVLIRATNSKIEEIIKLNN